MIRLKSGTEIGYDENFEVFFQKLLSSIIAESMQSVRKSQSEDIDQSEFNKLLAKEIMDNAIFVSHQIFEIGRINQNLAKFLVTGFLFNSIILSIPNLSDTINGDRDPDGSGSIH
jgi:hypothetical protein